ncbi:MAG: phytochelatin synthase [Desulfobacterales bacterium RIFOXYA12_FULL_46_15]|nr:MAG: phytochelatin synthase [Desulfobacterales bacterium RIFOXYA12_FULL_46_15]
MNFLKWVIRPYLYTQYHISKLARTGSFGKKTAVYRKAQYQKTGNFIKDGLFAHHVKQFHESSCSVATIASIINVLLEKQGRLPEMPLTQQDLLETVKTAHWKERMSDNGYKGRRGLPLPVLGEVVRGSLDIYGISYKSLEIIQVSADPEKSKAMKKALRTRLEQFETRGDCILIAHFDQGSVLPELHIPHISPVGGFDRASGKVTFLDVDPDQAYPYQVSFDTFYTSLASNYNPIFRHFGYAEGGYVVIQL